MKQASSGRLKRCEALEPLEPQASADLDRFLPASALVDPERPADPEVLVREFVPPDLGPSMARRIARFAVELVALAVLAAAWRWTPLGDSISLESVPPLAVLAAFIVAPLLGVPITLLIVAACFLFPPLTGGLYALAGALLSAAATYGAARLLGRNAVRRLAGWRLNAVTRRLARKGVWAVAALRLLPIASFATVSAVAGASRIRLTDLMLGTALGMAPWIVLTLTFVDRVRAVLRDPGPASTALLAADIILILLAVFFLWRRFPFR